MKRRFIIPEDKLNKLLGVIMNEQMGSTATPAKDAQLKMVTNTLSTDSLFPTGKADPDTNSADFKKVADAITNSAMSTKKLPLEVKVQGGASAVGTPGFNNKALADKRAANMISLLSQGINFRLEQKTGNKVDVGDYITFTQLPSVVGKSTVKDSPEAKAEQFVKVSYPSVGVGVTPPTTAVDTTATGKVNVPGGSLTGGSSKEDVERQMKGMKSVVIRSSDGKSVYKLNQNQYNELNAVLNKYKMFIPSSVITQTGGKPSL